MAAQEQVSHHRTAALDITKCTAELPDPVSDLTILHNVLLNYGHYHVYKKRVSSGAHTRIITKLSTKYSL